MTSNGSYVCDPVVATAPGVYPWVASYGGDDNTESGPTVCDAANQTAGAVTAAGNGYWLVARTAASSPSVTLCSRGRPAGFR